MSVRTFIEDVSYTLSNAWNGAGRSTQKLILIVLLAGVLLAVGAWKVRGWITSPSFALTDEEQKLMEKVRNRSKQPAARFREGVRVPWSDDYPDE